jgi:uncharacterized protein involved in exopolysaccharide biosynthesis
VAVVIRYLETFYRHKRLFALPLLIGLAISVTFALVQPQTSIATTRIWYDFTASVPLTSGVAAGATPADGEAQVMTELLHTRSFCTQVFAHSPLRSYLQTPTGYAEAVDTVTALKTNVNALLGRRLKPMSDATLAGLTYDLLAKQTTVIAAGPQIVVVTLTLKDPTVATGTLQAIVDQYTEVVLSDRKTQSQTAVDFWQQQVDQQPDRITVSAAAVAAYLHLHPELAQPNAIPDPTLTKLRNAENLDLDRYTTLLANLDAAKLTLAASTTPAASGFKLIDPPASFDSATGLKKQLFFAFGGLLLGIIISGAGIVALTLLDPTLRREEDVRVLGLRVVSSIPRFDNGEIVAAERTPSAR